MERGFTLVSLVVALALVALVLASTLPRVARQRDRLACLAARDALIARAERTRSEATRLGSAALIVDPDSARVWWETGGHPRDTLDLRRAFGVDVVQPTGRTLHLAFDRLGIGRFASATIVLARGTEQASVVVSSYGRIAR